VRRDHRVSRREGLELGARGRVAPLEEEDAPAVAHRARADDGPQSAHDPPAATDHLADIVRGDVQTEHEGILALFRLHAYRFRVVDELPREIREQLFH